MVHSGAACTFQLTTLCAWVIDSRSTSGQGSLPPLDESAGVVTLR